MIIKSKVIIGATYKHKSGMKYNVEKLILDATGYESTGTTKVAVLYTQLSDGKFPSGTQWVRTEEDFLKNFALLVE